MFTVIDIAQAEFKLHNDKSRHVEAMEGMTAPAHNVVDRMVHAVRTLLTSNASKTDHVHVTLHPADAVEY